MSGNDYEEIKRVVDEILNTKRTLFWDFDFGKSLKIVRVKYFNP